MPIPRQLNAIRMIESRCGEALCLETLLYVFFFFTPFSPASRAFFSLHGLFPVTILLPGFHLRLFVMSYNKSITRAIAHFDGLISVLSTLIRFNVEALCLRQSSAARCRRGQTYTPKVYIGRFLCFSTKIIAIGQVNQECFGSTQNGDYGFGKRMRNLARCRPERAIVCSPRPLFLWLFSFRAVDRPARVFRAAIVPLTGAA